MSAPTAARRADPVVEAERHDLVSVVLSVCGYVAGQVDPADVLTVHIGTEVISIRRRVRGRGGKIVPGMTVTTSHRIIPEPEEGS